MSKSTAHAHGQPGHGDAADERDSHDGRAGHGHARHQHCPQILHALRVCLTGHFDVEHSAFQLEPAGHTAHETGAHP